MLVPAGFTGFSAKDAGGSDDLDSDVNPAGANAGFTDPFDVPPGLDISVDAGISDG